MSLDGEAGLKSSFNQGLYIAEDMYKLEQVFNECYVKCTTSTNSNLWFSWYGSVRRYLVLLSSIAKQSKHRNTINDLMSRSKSLQDRCEELRKGLLVDLIELYNSFDEIIQGIYDIKFDVGLSYSLSETQREVDFSDADNERLERMIEEQRSYLAEYEKSKEE